jgi:S1-C subfamily serine protease
VAIPDETLEHLREVLRQATALVVAGGATGSAFFVTDRLLLTAAHVVAGQDDTLVVPEGSPLGLHAQAIGFDPRNDVAVLAVPGLATAPLALVDPRQGRPVAIVGYPENGPLYARPARLGRTATVLSGDAYGHGPVARTITSLRGIVRHGNSGGPAVDARGNVEAMVFGASAVDARVGYGVPAGVIARDLRNAHTRVSTGDCAP